jgi:hypothetical protein
MSDPFNILGEEFDNPPRFNDALLEVVGRVEAAVARFEELAAQIPDEQYTDDEWQVVERANRDVEEAVERADESFIAVQYDSHAWYRIMESMEQVSLRLQSAIGIMERVRERME